MSRLITLDEDQVADLKWILSYALDHAVQVEGADADGSVFIITKLEEYIRGGDSD